MSAKSRARKRLRDKQEPKLPLDAAAREAKDLGLFLVTDQGKYGPEVSIYSQKTGKIIGWWAPDTGRFRVNGVNDICKDRWKVLCIAAGRLNELVRAK